MAGQGALKEKMIELKQHDEKNKANEEEQQDKVQQVQVNKTILRNGTIKQEIKIELKQQNETMMRGEEQKEKGIQGKVQEDQATNKPKVTTKTAEHTMNTTEILEIEELDSEDDNGHYMTQFLPQFFQLLAGIDNDTLAKIVQNMKTVVDQANSEGLLKMFDHNLRKRIITFAQWLSALPGGHISSLAKIFARMSSAKHKHLSVEMNEIIELLDWVYNDEEADHMSLLLWELKNIRKSKTPYRDLVKNFVFDVLLRPLMRQTDDVKKTVIGKITTYLKRFRQNFRKHNKGRDKFHKVKMLTAGSAKRGNDDKFPLLRNSSGARHHGANADNTTVAMRDRVLSFINKYQKRLKMYLTKVTKITRSKPSTARGNISSEKSKELYYESDAEYQLKVNLHTTVDKNVTKQPTRSMTKYRTSIAVTSTPLFSPDEHLHAFRRLSISDSNDDELPGLGSDEVLVDKYKIQV